MLTRQQTPGNDRPGYWLDGTGHRIRLRLNLRHASLTKIAARQFALHEVLGHGLQGASWTRRCATNEVAWFA